MQPCVCWERFPAWGALGVLPPLRGLPLAASEDKDGREGRGSGPGDAQERSARRAWLMGVYMRVYHPDSAVPSLIG